DAAADAQALRRRVSLPRYEAVPVRVVGVDLPPEQLAVEGAERGTVLADDLEVHNRVSHGPSLPGWARARPGTPPERTGSLASGGARGWRRDAWEHVGVACVGADGEVQGLLHAVRRPGPDGRGAVPSGVHPDDAVAVPGVPHPPPLRQGRLFLRLERRV